MWDCQLIEFTPAGRLAVTSGIWQTCSPGLNEMADGPSGLGDIEADIAFPSGTQEHGTDPVRM